MPDRRVLGIDLGRPGGYAVVGPGERLERAGPILRNADEGQVLQQIRELLEADPITDVATEQVGTWGRRSVGASQRGMLDLVRAAVADEWRLRRRRNSQRLHKRVLFVNAKTLRVAICGNGNASKEQVGRTVETMYPCVRWYDWGEKEREHVLDAVAVAVTALRRLGK